MYLETTENIIQRIERMADRFSNAHKPVHKECALAIEKIRTSSNIEMSLVIEKQLLILCNEKFPIDLNDIDAGLDFGVWKAQHSDANYVSPAQKKA